MTALTFLKDLMSEKTSASKECDICYYWYKILYKGFKLQQNVYNSDHDLLMMSMNVSDIYFKH